MPSPRALKSDKLYASCPASTFRFKTTQSLKEPTTVLGQERAVEAIRFGIDIGRKGYNLFAMGPSGYAKHRIVRKFLDERAAKDKSAAKELCDWVYVFNFEENNKPQALSLPFGTAREFREDVEHLVTDLVAAIPAAFESDEYRAQRNEIEQAISEEEQSPLEELGERIRPKGVSLVRTPSGLAVVPTNKDGEIIDPEAFGKLSQKRQKTIANTIKTVQEELQEIIQQAPRFRRQLQKQIRDLNQAITRGVVDGLFADLRKKYAKQKEVMAYLNAIADDIVDNASVFQHPQPPQEGAQGVVASQLAIGPPPEAAPHILARYRVNVLIHRKESKGRPVVYEDNPTFENLVGSIEHIAEMGALLTDFTLIKAGALHRANGGYLIIDAMELLRHPSAYDGLKRALTTEHIHTEPLGKRLSLLSTITIEPEPIPLDVKVVLLGDRRVYYLLQRYDPDFDELFKVSADFEETIPRDRKNVNLFAQTLGSICRSEELLPFNAAGVGRMVEHASREADDAQKLSVRILTVTDIAQEADFLARKANKRAIGPDHVQAAIDAEVRRVSRAPERMREAVLRETLLIDTAGERVGQINALAVYQLGGHAFGSVSRVTVRTRQGSGKVIDIEREVNLGGPLHTKGVLILSSYLASTYLPDHSLSLSASIVFEQHYSKIDGDSASSTELYALLSALADAPIKQSLAVTGSVNQFGEVQAIGGVNEKVEGFFDLCAARGLTGDQGVLIPDSNVKHLMLKQEIRDAVDAGEFHLYPVRHIDEGIEILTGIPGGKRLKSGGFTANSINARVEARLEELRSASKDDEKNGKKRRGKRS
ncbi:MAG: ATP-binding protein [Verrucomicrobiota bacterium]